MFEKISAKLHACAPEVCKPIIELAVEIAREGREGRRIGTLFTIGDAEQVLAHSRPLILDPIANHPADFRAISNANLRGTLKELAQLDGAFVFDENGRVVAGCRYLDAKASDIELPWASGVVILLRHPLPKSLGQLRSWFPKVRLSAYSRVERW